MSRIGAVVFARLDSRRLPGKALLPLGDRPLLAHVLARVKAARGTGKVVLATSNRALDDAIAALGASLGVTVFRGETEDVLTRALACAMAYSFDGVIRISGDSPFVDPHLIDRAVATALETDADLVTNVFPRSFPPGDSVEVATTPTLRRVSESTDERGDREYVTRYIYAHPETYRIVNIEAPAGRYDGLSLTVDTPADLELARWVVARYDRPPEAMPFDDIVALAREFQHLAMSPKSPPSPSPLPPQLRRERGG